ncbi:PREDICTED: cytochrome c oxidase assembly protein COX16 homolog, mitochondrial-like, partial [Mesitornis unicolor]|uniref:cytochrome c oxidase assembly protein COX16 homolog, mitochondrial-like n=1 Tax=Mesitornis unicolor TaxID=54374 RepID=UPI0005287E79
VYYGTHAVLYMLVVSEFQFCLREEEKLKKLEKSDLDNWENIRGPRLWEDSRTVQRERREALGLRTQ